MKKSMLILLSILLCTVFLFGCMPNLPVSAPESREESNTIVVTVSEIKAGMSGSDLTAGVTYNGEAISAQIERWYYAGEKEMPITLVMTFDETISGYVDVFYYLPEGVSLNDEDLVIRVEAQNAVVFETTAGPYPSDTQEHVHTHIQFDLSAE